MSDNTPLNLGAGGDTVRDIDRSLNPVPVNAKTQVVHLDCGGQQGPEILVTPISPLPTVAGGADLRVLQALKMQHLLLAQAGGSNGFMPQELPSFLGGF
jgi:hypothetical protein